MLIEERFMVEGLLILIDRLKESQRNKKLRDTGASAASLRPVVTIDGEGITGDVIGLSRLIIQERGRGPNRSRRPSRDMVENMKGWAVRHGLPESAGWPIAMKIAQQGTPVPNPHNPGGVLSEVLQSANVKTLFTPLLKNRIGASLREKLFN